MRINIFKKCTATVLAILLMFSICPVGLFEITASAATSGLYTYTVSNGKATITDVDTSISGDITIPATLGGYTVTTIGGSAFYNCTGLKSVTVGNGVATINSYAFQNCTGLTSITIGNGIKNVYSRAFDGCTALEKVNITDLAAWCNISFNYSYDYTSNPIYYAQKLYLNDELITDLVIPNGVTGIGGAAFYNCKGLTSVTIPDSVTTIGSSAFYDCTGLTSVTIGNGVATVNEYAFKNCTGLTSITIGNGIENIYRDAFNGCTALEKVNITDLAAWCNISFNYSYSFTSNPIYYAQKLYLNDELVTDLVIPNGVTGIGSVAFYNCKGFTSVTIPDSVTYIGYGAFANCSGLKTATIGNGVINIENCAFEYCTWLTGVTIGNSVKSIGNYAFDGCTRLASVKIPDSVTIIGSYAFQNCKGLKTATIGNGVTDIRSSAFIYCTGLTSVTIGNGVKSIGDSAFYGCTGLASVKIPDSVTTIGGSAFYNCTGLKSVTIGNGVATVNSYAFKNCTGLTSITIGNGIESIYQDAFYGCTALEKVNITDLAAWCNIYNYSSTSNPIYYAQKLYLNDELVTDLVIPNGVTSIGRYAFFNCDGLTSVTIPDSVTYIGYYAFDGCGNITDVYYEGTPEEWQNVKQNNQVPSSAELHYNSKWILKMEIFSKPAKLKYKKDGEKLDLTGGYVEITHNNGTIEKIEMSKLTVTGFDNSKIGDCELTLSYGDFSVKLTVEIEDTLPLFVKVTSAPKKLFYKLGEDFDINGGKLAVGYDNGKWEYEDMTADMISGFDNQKYGEQKITVTHKGYTSEFTAEVYKSGDLDGDLLINAADITQLKKSLLSVISGNAKFDVNDDGATDIRDLIRLKKLSA